MYKGKIFTAVTHLKFILSSKGLSYHFSLSARYAYTYTMHRKRICFSQEDVFTRGFFPLTCKRKFTRRPPFLLFCLFSFFYSPSFCLYINNLCPFFNFSFSFVLPNKAHINMEPNTISVFGRVLQDDTLNKINQTDNSTVIITPRYNTTGQTELKVQSCPFRMYTFLLIHLAYVLDRPTVTF